MIGQLVVAWEGLAEGKKEKKLRNSGLRTEYCNPDDRATPVRGRVSADGKKEKKLRNSGLRTAYCNPDDWATARAWEGLRRR